MSTNNNSIQILIVEDEAIIGMEIQARLGKLGYSAPLVVDTGEKAIEQAGKMKPAVVLMDISLKGAMDGIEAAESIQQLYAIPVVFLTANTDEATFQRAKLSGPFGYILKPFQERELHTAIEIALYKRQKEEEIYRYQSQLEEMVRQRTEELSRTVQELEEAKYNGELANKVKDEILANMNHELRTPLNGILGNTDLLLMRTSDGTQKQQLKVIKDCGLRLLHRITAILDFVQLETGSVDLAHDIFSLEDVIQSAISMHHSAARAKYLDLNSILKSGIPSQLEGDSQKLICILDELIGNAVKFCDQGSIELIVRNENQNDEQVTLLFEVADKGPGIEPALQEKMFASFTQKDGSYTRKHGGTGMGLALGRKLAELMGGEMWMNSTPGQGTTIYFTTQFRVVPTATEEKQLPEENTADLSQTQILVVEDNQCNRDLFCTIIKAGGYTALTAENGLEGLRVVAENDVDMIIMDVQMPVMDGIEATQFIRCCEKGQLSEKEEYVELSKKLVDLLENSHIPIIAYTGNATDYECKQAGMDAFLSKPVSIETIFSVINTFLKKKTIT